METRIYVLTAESIVLNDLESILIGNAEKFNRIEKRESELIKTESVESNVSDVEIVKEELSEVSE
jgi:hypothetical protein